jgi:FAD/FMN-containing dehydrogenase
MGLTGIVCRVDVRLAKVPSSYVVATHRRTSNIEETCRLVLDPAYDDTHTVAWIDATTGPRSVGRAIVMSAHHASIEELPEAQRSHPFALHAKARANIRFDFPSWILNRVGMRAFNATYYALNGRSRGPVVSHVVPFFFPLDNVENWNRIYGNRGFFQYQFVVPNAPVSAIARILEMIRSDHSASFLTVLKRFGNSDCGWLSFPMQGLTVTLDLPYRGAPTLKLLDKLDDVVMQHGGRVYLAKDARMQPSTFRAMYPNFSKWLETKHQIDPDDEFQSLLSRRLGMHREQWHPGC